MSASESPQLPPTLRHIAAALDMNVATVSRGLRDSPRVAPATRSRIQAYARQVGYHPDPAVASLSQRRWQGRRSARTSTLAFLRGRARGQPLFFADALRAARLLGYHLIDLPLARFKSDGDVMAELDQRGVRGLLLGTFPMTTVLPDLEWERFAAVICGDQAPAAPIHRVLPDTFAAADLAVRTAWQRGYRRIALVRFPVTVDNDRRRIGGYQAALAEGGGNPMPDWELTDELPSAAAIQRWRRRWRIDCLILPNQRYAQLFQERWGTRRSPGIILSSDQGPAGGYCRIRLGLDQVGPVAVRHLATALHHHRYGLEAVPTTTVIAPSWQEGSSLPEIG